MTLNEYEELPDAERQSVIAELCGWTKFETNIISGRLVGRSPFESDPEKLDYLPDYLNDLNACHEFEKGLSDVKWVEYQFNLCQVVGVNCTNHRDVHLATAEQRCEAFAITKQPTVRRTAMKIKEAEYIKSVYDGIEEGEPDISTCRLLQMTTDICLSSKDPLSNGVQDVSDVCDALIMVGGKNEG